MRKFKLIKEYPGSLKLGHIISPVNNNKNSDDNYYINGNWITPKDYPEFWEEIVEKDYEILSFISTSTHVVEKKGVIRYINDDGYTAEDYLYNGESVKNGAYLIHSVKRLSDGEIFTIGDLVGTPGSIYPLKEFKIIDSENTVAAHCYKNKIGGSGHYNYRLKNLKKAKQPLFKTEDGVDIFEDCEVYQIDNNFTVFYYISWKNYYGDNGIPKPGYKWFSTKEKAEEYILMNKPCLSLKEIKENTTIKGLSLKKLQKLVQQKLNK